MSTLCAYHLRLGTVRLGTVRLGLLRLGTVKLVLVLVQQGMIKCSQSVHGQPYAHSVHTLRLYEHTLCLPSEIGHGEIGHGEIGPGEIGHGEIGLGTCSAGDDRNAKSSHTCRCRRACSLSLSAPAGYNTPWNRTECSVRTECAHCTLCAHFLGCNPLCTYCIHTLCVRFESSSYSVHTFIELYAHLSYSLVHTAQREISLPV